MLSLFSAASVAVLNKVIKPAAACGVSPVCDVTLRPQGALHLLHILSGLFVSFPAEKAFLSRPEETFSPGG